MGEENKRPALKGLAELVSLGVYLVATIFIGFGLGFYLDKYFSTRPWLTIIFLIFGIAAGFKHLFQTVKKYGDGDDQDKKSG